MNFTQMHERLRLELLRRIQRGTLSVSLLARQTGFGQSHVSNFLHHRRQLSLEALDRVLAAQHLTADDLLPVLRRGAGLDLGDEETRIPLVSHHAAIFEPYIRPSAGLEILHVSAGSLTAIRTRASQARRAWQRFVAIRIPASDAAAMEPLILPEAVVLVDRHYNSLAPYWPARLSLYAVRHGAGLSLRYVDLVGNRLILRPHNRAWPVELIEVNPGESAADLIVGRVAQVLNET